jgi:pimeloyl-ACP methyl ester carboxylesterase
MYRYWREDHLRCYAERAGRVLADGSVRLTFGGAIEAALYASNDMAIWPDLAHIACPTLMVRGEKSLAMKPYLLAEALETIPDVRLVTLSRCGHFPPMENPEAFVATVVEWLDA